MSVQIISAWYGAGNQTREATNVIQQAYAGILPNGTGPGQRDFAAVNSWVGDPVPGVKKHLFIMWSKDGVVYSGMVSENDPRGITLP